MYVRSTGLELRAGYPLVRTSAKLLRAGVTQAVRVAMRLSIFNEYRHASGIELMSPRRDKGGVAKDAGTSPNGRLAFT